MITRSYETWNIDVLVKPANTRLMTRGAVDGASVSALLRILEMGKGEVTSMGHLARLTKSDLEQAL